MTDSFKWFVQWNQQIQIRADYVVYDYVVWTLLLYREFMIML